jgi:hypothetical protein
MFTYNKIRICFINLFETYYTYSLISFFSSMLDFQKCPKVPLKQAIQDLKGTLEGFCLSKMP